VKIRQLLPAFGLAGFLFAQSAALALDPNSLKPQGYVSDFAHVLDANSRAMLEDYCARVEQATGVQMALVTIDSLEGDPIEDFTNALYRKWGVGKKGKDEGIMLLLAIKDRKSRVEVGYGLEPILPDGFVGGVLRESRPYLSGGQYGQAMLAAAEQMGGQIAKAKGVALDFSLRRSSRPVVRGRGIPWPLIVIGILLLLALLRRGGGGGGFLTGMILGNVLGQSGRWGGGGFGGSDSGGGGGGGFGGFGGGDSGGGGASSDW
jgi:uncharacterized protein